MNTFDVEGYEKSFLPDGKWQLVWHDDFDGIFRGVIHF